MNARIKILSLVAEVLAVCPLAAQTTYEEMEQLTVNEQVTTVITATEPVRFVDISFSPCHLPDTQMCRTSVWPCFSSPPSIERCSFAGRHSV